MKKVTILLCFLLSFQISQSQNYQTYGQEFWFGYMENLDLIFNGDPYFSVYVYSEEAGEGTITTPAAGLTVPFTYEADEVKEVLLPTSIYYDQGSEDIENLGLKVELSTVGQVFAFHYRLFFTESSLIYPVTALGTEYLVVADLDSGGAASSPSSFLIIATEDNTEIEITPTGLTLGLQGAGTPFNITMNAGQSFQVQSLEDLSGSRVRSTNNKKLAVFGGALKANVQCSGADNHLYDQLLPIEHAATSFPLIPFGEQSLSYYKVVATADNTEVFLNGDLEVTLNAGEADDFILQDPKMLSSNLPVHVAQFNPSQGCTGTGVGDPNMLTLAPTQMRIYKTGVFNFNTFENGPVGSFRYITLFTETDNLQGISVDGQNVINEFNPFPGNEEYSYARIQVSPGEMILSAPNGVLAYAYGFGEYDAYSYHLAYETPTTISVFEYNESDNLVIWPKPFVHSLNLKNEGDSPIRSLRLYNTTGQLMDGLDVIAAKASMEWNLKQLPAGLYVLTYQIGQEFFSKKVVKQ